MSSPESSSTSTYYSPRAPTPIPRAPSAITFSGDRSDELRGVRRVLGVAPFEDGQYVRLLNRGRRCGGYLFADESGQGVSTDHRRWMVNTAWRVHIVDTGGAHSLHVVLLGAYGRHLSAAPSHHPHRHDDDGHIGSLATQRVFDTVMENHAMWRTFQRSVGGTDVLLLNENSPTGHMRALRANGKHLRWNRGVTHEPFDRNDASFSSMMVWEVQVIPTSVQRPPYQLGNAARCFGLWRQDSREIKVSVRVADNNGNFSGPGGEILSVSGRSLIELGNALERRFGDGYSFQNISIFIRAGDLGRPFPLLTDLPSGLHNFEVVVFMVDTPGYNRLRFPDIHAA